MKSSEGKAKFVVNGYAQKTLVSFGQDHIFYCLKKAPDFVSRVSSSTSSIGEKHLAQFICNYSYSY